MPFQDHAVADLTEYQLLARIFPRLELDAGHAAATVLGPGDDAAIISAPDGRSLVSIDTQVQDQDFRLSWPNGYATTGADVGWKAAAQNLSDINAMGGTAVSLVVSLTLPPGVPVAWVEDLADGLVQGIRTLGADRCSIAGGDLGRGREISVTVAVLGTLDGGSPVLRSGARPGDVVALAGTAGRAAAGLALLESDAAADTLTPEQLALLQNQCRPVPPLAAGPAARKAGATAMLDISDGLVRDAARIATASNVVLDFDPARLRPLAAPLRPASDLLRADPMAWVLGGGEDHGLLATFPPDFQLPAGFTAIGSVQAPTAAFPEGHESTGVTVAGQPANSVGWDHFAH